MSPGSAEPAVRRTESGSGRGSIALTLLVGVAFAATMFDAAFVAGTGDYWTRPYGDRITNVIGSLYYARDAWRFPLFYVPALGFPEGASIVFTDSLPLLALGAKLWFRVFGAWPNYFGAWTFLCFPLLALFTALAVREAGATRPLAVIAAVLLALASPALLARIGHMALLAHFLVMWAFWLYLRLLREPGGRAGPAGFVLVAALAVVLQAYFVLMVMPFLAAALAQNVATRRVSAGRALATLAAVCATVVLVAWIAGILVPGKSAVGSWGFGHYSMNALSPFLPPKEHLPESLAARINWSGNDYTWDATGGQYEGYNYLGAGMLLLLAIHLLGSPRLLAAALRRHAFLALALLALCAFALSNRIFVGDQLVAEIALPSFAAKLTQHFRTGGRLFWPVYYALVPGLVLLTAQRFGARTSSLVLLAAVALQLADTQLHRRDVAEHTRSSHPQMLEREPWTRLVAAHSFIRQFPSFQCGGWGGDWPQNNSNMELLLIAAEAGVPTNSAYLARVERNCPLERDEGAGFDVEPGGLYVYGGSFPLAAISGEPGYDAWCRRFAYGVACSRNRAAVEDAARAGLFDPGPPTRGPAYRPGDVLVFAANGNGLAHLGDGWSVPEPWGTWSVGAASELELALPHGTAGALELVVESWGFAYPARPENRITVSANGVEVATWTYRLGEAVAPRTARVPAAAVADDGLLRLRFAPADFTSPREAGVSEDPRPLALGLVTLVLRPAPN